MDQNFQLNDIGRRECSVYIFLKIYIKIKLLTFLLSFTIKSCTFFFDVVVRREEEQEIDSLKQIRKQIKNRIIPILCDH